MIVLDETKYFEDRAKEFQDLLNDNEDEEATQKKDKLEPLDELDRPRDLQRVEDVMPDARMCPFPYQDDRPDPGEIVEGKVTKKRVMFKDLYSGQIAISKKRVKKIMKKIEVGEYDGSDPMKVIVVRHNGKEFIWAGHHHCTALLLSGYDSVETAHHIEIEKAKVPVSVKQKMVNAVRAVLQIGTSSSGNYDHAGRPGEVGGSGEGGEHPAITKGYVKKDRTYIDPDTGKTLTIYHVMRYDGGTHELHIPAEQEKEFLDDVNKREIEREVLHAKWDREAKIEKDKSDKIQAEKLTRYNALPAISNPTITPVKRDDINPLKDEIEQDFKSGPRQYWGTDAIEALAVHPEAEVKIIRDDEGTLHGIITYTDDHNPDSHNSVTINDLATSGYVKGAGKLLMRDVATTAAVDGKGIALQSYSAPDTLDFYERLGMKPFNSGLQENLYRFTPAETKKFAATGIANKFEIVEKAKKLVPVKQMIGDAIKAIIQIGTSESGNFGHSGRPGEVGGSGPGGEIPPASDHIKVSPATNEIEGTHSDEDIQAEYQQLIDSSQHPIDYLDMESSVGMFIHDGFRVTNPYLRGNTESAFSWLGDDMTDQQKIDWANGQILGIDDTFKTESISLPAGMELWRGVGEDTGRTVSEMKVGDICEDKAFQSFSTDPYTAGNFARYWDTESRMTMPLEDFKKQNIVSRTVIRAITSGDEQAILGSKIENEVIINRGTQWQVVSNEKLPGGIAKVYDPDLNDYVVKHAAELHVVTVMKHG